MALAGRAASASERVETIAERAWAVAAEVIDPELPMLTLADLGVLRSVEVDDVGRVEVAITPTYSGCPAMATMRDDLVHRLTDEGYAEVRVRVQLEPAWTTDWISEHGRTALREAGISAPGPAPRREGPVPLTLGPVRRALTCPQCGSGDVEVTSEFGSTACKALYRCRACLEPFDHLKEI
jgi:ring-1,2-phenylacetyl-CoA epoxidase subunit PaaD